MNCESTHKNTHKALHMKSHLSVTKIMELKKRDLNRIRRSMPTGWKDKMIAESKFSKSYIEKVLLGLRKNELIIQLSVKMCGLNSEQKDLLKSKIHLD